MWPPKLLDQACAVLFQNEEAKLQTYFRDFVSDELWPTWASQCSKLSGLIDLRDFAEDALALLSQQYGANLTDVPMDKLIKSIKATPDAFARRKITVSFIHDQAMRIGPNIDTRKVHRDLVAYLLDREVGIFFNHARDIIKYRPVLQSPVETLEAVVRHMEQVGQDATLDHFLAWAADLGLKTLWPVLALYIAEDRGHLEETFLHVPMPRVFGAPSCVRNAIEKRVAPKGLCKSTPRSNVDLRRIVVAGHGTLAFTTSQGEKRLEVPQAHLVAGLPGTSRRLVWCLEPKRLNACIVDLALGKAILEFDVPQEGHDGEPNWIDCQRDSEGRLVLMWGHINGLTGALGCQNVMGLDEDTLEAFDADPDTVPSRTKVGSRIDYRDHGNLLSVHHVVQDSTTGPSNNQRSWDHVYQIVFGQNQILEMSSKNRPVTAIYGSPVDFALLSPLSSTSPLQRWALQSKDGVESYQCVETCSVPKLFVGSWTSITMA
jgi:hypothetical protein